MGAGWGYDLLRGGAGNSGGAERWKPGAKDSDRAWAAVLDKVFARWAADSIQQLGREAEYEHFVGGAVGWKSPEAFVCGLERIAERVLWRVDAGWEVLCVCIGAWRLVESVGDEGEAGLVAEDESGAGAADGGTDELAGSAAEHGWEEDIFRGRESAGRTGAGALRRREEAFPAISAGAFSGGTGVFAGRVEDGLRYGAGRHTVAEQGGRQRPSRVDVCCDGGGAAALVAGWHADRLLGAGAGEKLGGLHCAGRGWESGTGNVGRQRRSVSELVTERRCAGIWRFFSCSNFYEEASD